MAANLKGLPTGQQIFSHIRYQNKLYVDKTRFIPLLEAKRPIVFLARPRRFGKSLTVSTLEAYFSGEKKCFAGLAAETSVNSADFRPKPLIHLNMSQLRVKNLDTLEESLIENLRSNAQAYNIPLRGSDVVNIFSNLIKDLRENQSKQLKKENYSEKQIKLQQLDNVVLLIDEYDSPMLRLLQKNPEKMDQNLIDNLHETLRSFFQQIKANEASLYFTFITGVTKFTRMSVFSELNNVTDISLEPDFASLVGFTKEELTTNFAAHIKVAAKELRISSTSLKKLTVKTVSPRIANRIFHRP